MIFWKLNKRLIELLSPNLSGLFVLIMVKIPLAIEIQFSIWFWKFLIGNYAFMLQN